MSHLHCHQASTFSGTELKMRYQKITPHCGQRGGATCLPGLIDQLEKTRQAIAGSDFLPSEKHASSGPTFSNFQTPRKAKAGLRGRDSIALVTTLTMWVYGF